MTDDIIHKDCSKCGRNLPLSKFNKQSGRKYGRASNCKECKRSYRSANQDKIKAQKGAWWDKNGQEVLARRREEYVPTGRHVMTDEERAASHKAANARYYAKNRDKILVKGKEYREKNRLRLREEARERYASDREKYQSRNKTWKKANPDKLKAQDFRRRARMSGGTLTAAEIKAIVAQDCFWCGTDCADDFHLDHIVPISKGGRNSRCNIAVSCPTCNTKKNAKDLSDWLREIGWR